MPLYALTIFAGAFLLFLVQPIVARLILPWFGGAAAVWTTCMLFFQTALLLGYAYAHASTARLSPRAQAVVHIGLLAVSVLALPILPGEGWKPSGDESPVLLILALLAATIGLPYLLLSSTSPLAQAWFARRFPGRSPYRLYALSNFASMLGLIGFPFLVEPWIGGKAQAALWSWLYGAFALLCAGTAVYTLRTAPAPVAQAAETPDDASPGWRRRLAWIALAAVPTALLLSVTSHLTQNLAPIPLLWMVPLAIYLATFILCFESDGWYRRGMFLTLTVMSIAGMTLGSIVAVAQFDLVLLISIYCIGLFVACMVCHGELAALRPGPRRLTGYFLTISFGGALGSLAICVGAPLLLNANYDIVVCMVALSMVVLAVAPPLGRPGMLLASAAVVIAAVGGFARMQAVQQDAVRLSRNFYGALAVKDREVGTAQARRELLHGIVIHGDQYLAPERRREAHRYYAPTSGAARALAHDPGRPRTVGMIGLGAGALAVYARTGESWRFYEIDPAVIESAKNDFTFLKDSAGKIELVLGDARLKLERESPQGFDLLAVDAFSGDAIPTHLITSEAVSLYLRHLAPGGVIAFHLSNKFLDLPPVAARLAAEHAMSAVHVRDVDAQGRPISDWVLLSRDAAALAAPKLAEVARPIRAAAGTPLWTDDYSGIVQVLKR